MLNVRPLNVRFYMKFPVLLCQREVIVPNQNTDIARISLHPTGQTHDMIIIDVIIVKLDKSSALIDPENSGKTVDSRNWVLVYLQMMHCTL